MVGMILLQIEGLVCWLPSPKRRRLVHAVRDRAFLPGPPGIWDSQWVTVPASAICADDVAQWPLHSLVLLAKMGGLSWFMPLAC